MGAAAALFLCFFAVYGLLQIIAKSVFQLRAGRGPRPAYIHRVIGVGSCADSIEGMVRSLAWQDLREEVFVLNLGADPETREILARLEREYEFLHVLTLEEYRDYLTRMEAGV